MSKLSTMFAITLALMSVGMAPDDKAKVFLDEQHAKSKRY
jgi:hypothetical protein